MKLVIIDSLPYGSPAAANHRRGIIYVAKDTFSRLNEDGKAFTLYHEAGHLACGSDESAADEWAFYEMLKDGYSVGQVAAGILNLLGILNRRAHFIRVYRTLLRALQYDYTVNGNKRARWALEELTSHNLPRVYRA